MLLKYNGEFSRESRFYSGCGRCGTGIRTSSKETYKTRYQFYDGSRMVVFEIGKCVDIDPSIGAFLLRKEARDKTGKLVKVFEKCIVDEYVVEIDGEDYSKPKSESTTELLTESESITESITESTSQSESGEKDEPKGVLSEYVNSYLIREILEDGNLILVIDIKGDQYYITDDGDVYKHQYLDYLINGDRIPGNLRVGKVKLNDNVIEEVIEDFNL